jgi:hypothetical protein
VKKLILTALLLCASAFAQTGLAPRPDCDFGFIYNVASGVITSTSSPTSNNRLPPTQSGSGIGWDNRATVCSTWTLYYQTEGVSAVSIELDQAPSSAGQAGTWVAWTNISPGTVYPLTALNVGQGSSFGYQPWVSVNLNSATGTGSVYGRVFGWKSAPGQGGTGLTSEQGAAPTAAPPVGNPVLVAGWDATNVATLKTATSGVIQTLSSSNVSDAQGANLSGTLAAGAASTAGLTVAPWVLNPNTTWDRLRANCNNPGAALTTTVVSLTGTTATQIIALAANKSIFVCSMILGNGAGTTPTFSLQYGTGSNCATGTVTPIPATVIPAGTAAPLIFNAPNMIVTPTGQALCYILTGTTPTGTLTLTTMQE